MEKEKYLFNASYKYGGSCNGIREFEIDFLKTAIEDKQFFDENWRVLTTPTTKVVGFLGQA